jgi:hypothetical protein
MTSSLIRMSLRVFLTACALLPTSNLHAQVFSSSITGLVTDATGAVIPSAQAVLTDEDKGFNFRTATGNDGRYVLRNLAPGRYKLAITAPGMRAFTSPILTLDVGQNAQQDVRLEVQGSVETVSVAGSAPLLQTQDASTGQIVNQKFINDLPLTSRSVFNLAQLSPVRQTLSQTADATPPRTSSWTASARPTRRITAASRLPSIRRLWTPWRSSRSSRIPTVPISASEGTPLSTSSPSQEPINTTGAPTSFYRTPR